jgi:hypothetical protein
VGNQRTAGLVLDVVITPASVPDRQGARPLLWSTHRACLVGPTPATPASSPLGAEKLNPLPGPPLFDVLVRPLAGPGASH